jgi:DNA-directed RNA polymerase subunit F
MIKTKKTEEELTQEREAAARLAEEHRRDGEGHEPLTPGLIKENPPNPAEDFASIMLTYHIPQGDVESIIKYINDTGNDNIYFDIPELIDKLVKFPRQIPPVSRRHIMDHWIALNKIAIPENYDKTVEATPKDYRKISGKEKYTVDEKGAILVASSDENALTYAEAEKLAERRKSELKVTVNTAGPKYIYDAGAKAIRMAHDNEPGGTLDEAKELKRIDDANNVKPPESPFMQTEDGQWALVPGAKLSTIEMMTWQSMQKAAAAGQPVDIVTEFANSAEKLKMIRDLFGGGNSVPAYLASPEAFAAAVKAAMGGDNQAVNELKIEIQRLREDQHAAELRQRDEAVNNLQTLVTNANNKIKELEDRITNAKPMTGKTAYDIVDKLPGTIKDVSQDIKSTIIDVMRSPGPLNRDPSRRTAELGNMADKMERVGKMKDFGDSWFNMS